MRKVLALGVVGALCVVGGWRMFRPSAHGGDQRLLLTGSSTIAPLAAEIAKRFEQHRHGVRVDVQTGGSSRGVKDARDGTAQIGMVSRALKPDEGDLVGVMIAWDGVAMIVNAVNAVATLTDDQVRAIYRGQTSNWSAVGGGDARIVVVNKAEGRSTLELFLHHFGLKPSDVRADLVIGENEEEIKVVAQTKDAIGYVSIGSAEAAMRRGVPIKALPMAGVAPSESTVRDGSFPLRRPLLLVTRPDPPPIAREFLAFATSGEINDLIKAQYFIALERVSQR